VILGCDWHSRVLVRGLIADYTRLIRRETRRTTLQRLFPCPLNLTTFILYLSSFQCIYQPTYYSSSLFILSLPHAHISPLSTLQYSRQRRQVPSSQPQLGGHEGSHTGATILSLTLPLSLSLPLTHFLCLSFHHIISRLITFFLSASFPFFLIFRNHAFIHDF
jgi:hypothetical protein